jgi:hypothetical protein
MAKTAKKPASGSSRDLFETAETAARRPAGRGKGARNPPPRASGEAGYMARDI